MREIRREELVEAVAGLCMEASRVLPEDVLCRIRKAREEEESECGKAILGELLENAELAERKGLPLCQDTGLALVFIDWGKLALLEGGELEDAVNDGVRRGYGEAFLRKSVVSDPLFERVNTGDNTPAIIYLRQVEGDRVRITVCPKGGGCENKSMLRLLTPSEGVRGVKRVVEEAVLEAGAGACPPFVIGVGIGGNSDVAMLKARYALLRGIGRGHPDPRYAGLEKELLELVNATGLGPQGFGGSITALKVNVEFAPTHIASLPVAVSISCHAARHAAREI